MAALAFSLAKSNSLIVLLSCSSRFFNSVISENIVKHYAKKCSFFLQLSFYEGFAMSVIEAMQLGLVPVVTNVGEISNYCIDNFNGVITFAFLCGKFLTALTSRWS